VGEFALVNPGPRSASVKAMTEVEVLEMDGPAFEKLRRNHSRRSSLRVRPPIVYSLVVFILLLWLHLEVVVAH